MNHFFEQELRKLFEDGETISSPRFSGRSCLGTLGEDLRVRVQFSTTGISDHYDALKIAVLNRTDGPVDTLTLKLEDVWGRKSVPNRPNFKDGVSPHIWVYQGKPEWYAWQPAQADRRQLCQEVSQYLEAVQMHTIDGPKLVYICAPLRGDVERNIEFARQKAQEVFQTGDIPVCPHLMFPPIADPENPGEDQTAREMGLRLVEACQEVHVYGPTWTEGMWAEIRHAMDLGIEVKTAQQTLGRTQSHQRTASSEYVGAELSTTKAEPPKSTQRKARNTHER